jgi:hypothetical protein
MKTKKWIFPLLLLAGYITCYAQQTNLQRAANILRWMKDAQSDSIYACFDAKMQQAVPLSQLKDMWAQVKQQLGPLEKEKEWKQDAIDGTVVYYTLIPQHYYKIFFLST